MADQEPMPLTDEAPTTGAEPNAADTVRDVDGVPYCPKHHCRMKARSGGKQGSAISYYRCPVKGCTASAKMIRTRNERIVPSEPQLCPRCSTPKAPVVCERDDSVSSAARVVLKCPQCGWKSNAMVVPTLAAAMQAHRKRRAAKAVGDR
ncbi:MAG: hypothetical protein AAF805_01170 [Planctomycetota bacterium]